MNAHFVATTLGLETEYQAAIKKLGEHHTCNQGCGEGWCFTNEERHQMILIRELNVKTDNFYPAK